ncbi:DUF6349 family protein [Janibacter hoylei]|uniref:DUF6349 family protein n=1 Tax=Janibacter hoylei TaxID=364298 RepID=UPI00248FA993|nr:DUF6349 family protein [Janibacter hoylei]
MAYQLGFDIQALIDEATLEAAGPWQGAPLGYTSDYYTPTELAEAFERFILENGHFNCLARSHMWRPLLTQRPLVVAGHELHALMAMTRCSHEDHDHEDLSAAGGYQANCPNCRWHVIAADEDSVIEALHDHAMPGWRDLPVMPGEVNEKSRRAWVEEHYPAEWQFIGAPVLTVRARNATRHVEGRSPFGGYDLCAEVAS